MATAARISAALAHRWWSLLQRRQHHTAPPGARLAQSGISDDRRPGGGGPARGVPAAPTCWPPWHLRLRGGGATRAPRHLASCRIDPGTQAWTLRDGSGGQRLFGVGRRCAVPAAAAGRPAYDANPAGFDKVEALSEITERFYSQWVSPWVRFAVTPDSARELRALHPMRVSRKVWSEQVTPALALLPWVQRWLEQWGAQGSPSGRKSLVSA